MKIATLGDIAEWGSGGTPRRSVTAYFGKGTPWLSIADLNDDVVHEARESLTPLGVASSSAKIVPAGAIFVAMYGSIGKLGIAGQEMCTSQAIAFAIPRSDVVDRRYMFHYLLAQRPLLQSRGRGGTQMNIGQADLKAWPIPLPSLDEQRHIAAILDRVNDVRTKRGQAIDLLDELANSIFFDMFGEPSSNPRGMPVRPLGEVAKLKSGAFLPATAMSPVGQHPVYGGNGISGFHDQYLFNTPQIILGRVGMNCGCVHLSPAFSWITDNALYISEMDDVVEMTYLYHALMRANLNQYSSKSAQPLISGARVYGVNLVIPPRVLQTEFATTVDHIDSIKKQQQTHLAQLDTLFVSLQHRAFRGMLWDTPAA